MNMKLNRKLKSFWLMAALLAAGSLTGQDLPMNGFAGKDQQVLFPPNNHTGIQTVTLGADVVSSNDCVFNWRVVSSPEPPTYSFNDAHSQRPVFSFGNVPGEYVIEATRVSKYGYQREYVCITVYSDIVLISGKAKYNCFRPGDALHEEDFEFVTRPEGYNDRVRIHPDYAIVKEIDHGYLCDNQEVVFQIEYDDGSIVDCSNKGKINVIADSGVALGIPMSDEAALHTALIKYATFLKANPELAQDVDRSMAIASAVGTAVLWTASFTNIDTPEEAISATHTLSSSFKALSIMGEGFMKKFFFDRWVAKGPGGINLALYGDPSGFSYGWGIECCDSKSRPAIVTVLDGNPKFEIGLTIDVGFPYLSLPGVGGIYMRGGITAGLEGHFDHDFVSSVCSNMPVTIHPELIGEVAVIAIARHPKILSVSIGAYPQAYGTVTIGYSEAKDGMEVKDWDARFKLDLEVRAVVVGFQKRHTVATFMEF